MKPSIFPPPSFQKEENNLNESSIVIKNIDNLIEEYSNCQNKFVDKNLEFSLKCYSKDSIDTQSINQIGQNRIIFKNKSSQLSLPNSIQKKQFSKSNFHPKSEQTITNNNYLYYQAQGQMRQEPSVEKSKEIQNNKNANYFLKFSNKFPQIQEYLIKTKIKCNSQQKISSQLSFSRTENLKKKEAILHQLTSFKHLPAQTTSTAQTTPSNLNKKKLKEIQFKQNKTQSQSPQMKLQGNQKSDKFIQSPQNYACFDLKDNPNKKQIKPFQMCSNSQKSQISYQNLDNFYQYIIPKQKSIHQVQNQPISNVKAYSPNNKVNHPFQLLNKVSLNTLLNFH